MFNKIQMILMMKTTISNNRISRLNEEQVHFDYNNSSETFPVIVHPVNQDVYARSNFDSSVSKTFGRPEPELATTVSVTYQN